MNIFVSAQHAMRPPTKVNIELPPVDPSEHGQFVCGEVGADDFGVHAVRAPVGVPEPENVASLMKRRCGSMLHDLFGVLNVDGHFHDGRIRTKEDRERRADFSGNHAGDPFHVTGPALGAPRPAQGRDPIGYRFELLTVRRQARIEAMVELPARPTPRNASGIYHGQHAHVGRVNAIRSDDRRNGRG